MWRFIPNLNTLWGLAKYGKIANNTPCLLAVRYYWSSDDTSNHYIIFQIRQAASTYLRVSGIGQSISNGAAQTENVIVLEFNDDDYMEHAMGWIWVD